MNFGGTAGIDDSQVRIVSNFSSFETSLLVDKGIESLAAQNVVFVNGDGMAPHSARWADRPLPGSTATWRWTSFPTPGC